MKFNKHWCNYCLANERPSPTFGSIFCIGSKFTRMSAHPGASFAWLIRVYLWSVENTVSSAMYIWGRKTPRYALPKGGFVSTNGAALASQTMPTVAFCHSECCVPTEHELPRRAASLYIIVCPLLERICGQWVAASIHGCSFVLNAETSKRVPTLLFCRLVRCSNHPCSFAIPC